MKIHDKTHIETLAVTSTSMHDKNGSVTPAIYLSTTFERNPDGTFGDHGYLYSRMDNPNRRVLEQSLAALERGTDAFAFASGMAAVAAVLQTLRAGDHVIMPDDAYYTVLLLTEDIFGPFGITCTRVDQSDLEQVRAAIQPNTKLIWMETPSNPLLKLADIEAIAKIAHEHTALCVVDNTWGTPVLQNPLVLGADIVMHSTTKYFGGHSDLLGGALIINNNPSLGERLRKIQKIVGAVPSAFDCWLVARGIRTLALRVRAQTQSAQQLAEYLSRHKKIESVSYPGLPSHPQYAIAKKQMSAPGAMLSIQIAGGKLEAMQLADNLKLFTHATSLGGVESLIEHRKSVEGDTSTTPDNLLRISVGIEHYTDLIADFEQALR